MSARHTLDLMGKTLRDLAPLVAAAVQALDKPGTRGLRRKLDGEFHFLVRGYGTLLRETTPEEQWECIPLPAYERATEVWPGRAAYEGRKAREAAAKVPAPTWSAEDYAAVMGDRPHAPRIRLAVDNTAARRISTLGGAA